MKLTFRVRICLELMSGPENLLIFSPLVQDLRQQKFTLDAEPSETVSTYLLNVGQKQPL